MNLKTPILAAVLLAGISSTVLAQESGDVRRGLTVARDVCSQCHAVERTSANSPNPRAPSFRAIAQTPGMTELGLYAALRTPHGGMPPLLPDVRDVRNVIAFIRSLEGPAEPE